MERGRARLLALLVTTGLIAAACSSAPTQHASRARPRSAPVTDPAAAAEGSAEVAASSASAASTVPRFSRRRAMRTIRHLANDIGVRVRTTEGETKGARYIARRFRDMGYDVHIQRFDVDGGTSRNVIASWPTMISAPFVIGAHMDTVPRSPGANDNASGVAVVLEMARIFAGRHRAQFIQFVAFGSEEYGKNGRHHIGSEVMVARMSARRRNRTPGMLSVDMIADGRPLLAGYSGIASDHVARDVYRKLRDAGLAMSFRVLCDCSDHGPFERAGIPAAFLWSGDEPNYHDPSDTPGNLVEADLSRTGRGVRSYLLTFSRALLDRYRRH